MALHLLVYCIGATENNEWDQLNTLEWDDLLQSPSEDNSQEGNSYQQVTCHSTVIHSSNGELIQSVLVGLMAILICKVHNLKPILPCLERF